METQRRSWWQKHKRLLIPATIVMLVLVFALAVYRFGWDWTGFNGGYGQITTTKTSPGTTTATVKPAGKTLWDLLQLLIIPVVLTIGGFWLNQIQKNREGKATEHRAETDREAAEKRAQTEREIAEDNQREAALQAYIDKMSDLLLTRGLRESTEDKEVRKIARVRTLTVLPRLDKERKRSVLQFLSESGLIHKGGSIIPLSEADLRGANLQEIILRCSFLSGANLSRADLSLAKLSEVNLHLANLSSANLNSADLSEADLRSANLSGASLIGADLRGANLEDVYLGGASLGSADLRGANLGEGAHLQEADLRGANLEGVHLRGADLSGANLAAANLSGVDLRGADLRGADLTLTKLSRADLSGANLSRADLSLADLKGAIGIVIEEIETKAKSLQDATMPDGAIHS